MRRPVIWPSLLLLAVLSANTDGTQAVQAREEPEPAQLARLRAYAERYRATMTSIVAHEHFVQNISNRRGQSRSVVLRSDVLSVRLPGSDEPVWFRDVYEVDDRPVRDREDRLLRLLQSDAPGSIDSMRRIAAESARFNLGRVPRTTNVPDLVFSYLVAPLGHVTLSSPRNATVAGERLVAWRFGEAGTPTVVRTASGRDMPARGRVWIDPGTGDVARSEVVLGDVTSSVTTTVDFVRHPKTPVRVPERMEEQYRTLSEYGVSKATYTDVRTFGVTTSELIKKPPPG